MSCAKAVHRAQPTNGTKRGRHKRVRWPADHVRRSHAHRAVTDLEAAWDEIHDAKPDGWFVGPPTHQERRHEWDYVRLRHEGAPEGRPQVAGETAVAQTELEFVREMAGCLRVISAGGWPS